MGATCQALRAVACKRAIPSPDLARSGGATDSAQGLRGGSGVEDAQGRFVYYCRLYLVNIEGAENVAGLASLAGSPSRSLTKRLVVNFDRVAGGALNLEAMA